MWDFPIVPAGLSTAGTATQDFFLGYCQSSLRDSLSLFGDGDGALVVGLDGHGKRLALIELIFGQGE